MYILFDRDWNKYPTARPDFNTTNSSFIRFVTTLKKMNISNHTWPLALIDQDLLNIDPRSPELTLREKGKVVVECKLNPWYYFREVLRAPANSGADSSPFRANRGNMAMFWLFFNHITSIHIWPRQEGKSFSSDCLSSYLMNVACKDTMINLLTKDDTLRSINIKRLKSIVDELPDYLKNQTRFDSKNSHEYTVKRLNNHFKGHLPASSPKRAYIIGRGLTSPIFLIDEPVYQPNISITLPSALTAAKAAREMAEEGNAPYGTVLTTTAGKQDDKDGGYIYKLLVHSSLMSEMFYDSVNVKTLERNIRANSKKGKLRVNCTFSHRQLGTSDERLLKSIEEINVTGDDMLRDFYNVWTNGTASSPLPSKSVKAINDSKIEPSFTRLSPQGYITNWYIKEEDVPMLANRSMVMGLDTSDAIGSDDIALVMRDLITGDVIATGTFNTTNIITFSQWLYSEWFNKYNKMVGIIERRSTGSSVIDYLLLMFHEDGKNPFSRLWNTVVDDKEVSPRRFEELNKTYDRNSNLHIKYKKHVGFSTSGAGRTSRDKLYSDTLMDLVTRSKSQLFDITLSDQILGLSIKNGRIDHADMENDDLVIASLLTQWFMVKANNLVYYNLNPLEVLSDIRHRDTTHENVNKRMAALKDKKIKERIDALISQGTTTKDFIKIGRIKSEIELLTRELSKADDVYNIDILLDKMGKMNKIKKSHVTRSVTNNWRSLIGR